MGIYDKVNGGTEPLGGPGGPELAKEEDYVLEVDLSNGMTVSGDFDFDFGGEASSYSFSSVTGTGGTLTTADTTTGAWTFTSDGTGVFGEDVSFTVTDGAIAGGDTDTVTITFTCFAQGTAIRTPSGDYAVEALAAGDLVLTRDSGPQPVRWVGSRRLETPGRMGAIVFRAGAIGNARELRVSPDHRMLVTGWRAAVLTGKPEVLVAARDLINGDMIYQDRKTPVTYYHILFDRHEIVTSEGVESESYNPSATGLADISPAARAEILVLFPELAVPGAAQQAARPTLCALEAAALGG
ncbi:MAG: Hint domain-containing protein [Pseudomonadota bacterium]